MAVETRTHTVTDADTAAKLGSGDLPVLATPRLISWLERLTHAVARTSMPEGQTTVGTLVKIEHLKATPVGGTIRCECSKGMSDGRRLIFHVGAFDEDDEPVAAGEIQRRVVDSDRFMSRFTASTD
jgi:fluoroacetyl-CoA thioesterase